MKRGPTFMLPEEIIERHKDGTLSERQAVVSLARLVLELQDQVRQLKWEQEER